MKKLLILICLSVCFYNCKSSKNTKAPTNVNSRPNKTTLPEDNSVKLNTTDFPDVSNTNSNKTETALAFNIIDYAKQTLWRGDAVQLTDVYERSCQFIIIGIIYL